MMFVLAVGLLAILPNGRAMAAPQVLAVLSSTSGIPFICQAGECRAELSTFCLQRDRETPRMGSAYRPDRVDSFALVVTDGKGARHRLSAEKVKFVANRGFMSATAVIPANVIKRLGIASATISVAKNASLVPTPVVGDNNPLSAQEIENATGPLRQFGAQVVDNSMNATAARMLSRVSGQFSPIESYQPEQLSGMWRKVKTAAKDDLRHPGGLRHARGLFDMCVSVSNAQGPFPTDEAAVSKTTAGFAAAMLRCLQREHDGVIRDVNLEYWKGLAGS